MRVKVFSGDLKEFLGNGTLVGTAKVYAILMPDGSMRSFGNAEIKPPDAYVKKIGGKLMVLPKNPKIRLSNGKVVYGCQVWFHETGKKARG